MAQNIRDYRHKFALLKKKGLDIPIDARSVKPSKKNDAILSRFDDVLSGKVTPVNISRKAAKDAGYETYKGKALVPHSAGERVGVSHGTAKVRQPKGITSVKIPVKYESMDQFIEAKSKDKKALDGMKRNDEYFAFRFFGHQSHEVFHNIEALRRKLAEYPSISTAIDSGNAEQMQEQLSNLEIVKVHRVRNWTESGAQRKAERLRPEGASAGAADYQRRKDRRAGKSVFSQLEFDRAQAEKQKRARARLKADPLAYNEYKEAAKKRAKKSRKKAKRERKKATKGLTAQQLRAD